MKHVSRSALGVFGLLLMAGCGLFSNHSRTVAPDQLLTNEGWIAIRNIEFVDQESSTQCGYAVSAMTIGYWNGQPVSLGEVARRMPKPSTRGITAATMRAYFRDEGFRAFVIRGKIQDLVHELSQGRPVIVGTVYRESDHFIAHYEVVSGINLRSEEIVTLDPRYGWRVSSINDFYRSWSLARRVALVVSAPAPRLLRSKLDLRDRSPRCEAPLHHPCPHSGQRRAEKPRTPAFHCTAPLARRLYFLCATPI